MLSQIEPTNEFDHSKQYSEATYKLNKYNDKALCCTVKKSMIDFFEEFHTDHCDTCNLMLFWSAKRYYIK